MKKAFRLFAMLLVASVLTPMFSACEKDNEPVPLTVEGLAGTSWRCTMENSFVQQVVTFYINLEIILYFKDTVNGEYFERIVAEVPEHPSANQERERTFDFTYTTQDNKILITIIWTDAGSGEEYVETAEFIYDAATQTITHDTDNPDMERIMGTDTYVYTKVQ